ncbi:MAG TPA: carboxypeptidase regulatory-like domain-containing protein [Terriglobia bacterium]|nr:carboxypeptidase regulatory-like domain-containing protein [Terriglobia bacterium]
MMKTIVTILLVGMLTLEIADSPLWAQAVSTAQIGGTVKDQSGAVLPGAEIKATQTATGAIRTAVSNETGSYALPNLPIGPYTLEVVLPGFRTYVQSGIILQVNSNPVINAVLQVGQLSETLKVEASAAMVETQSTGIGTVVDNQRVLEMPLNGRNATELIFLSGMANVPGPAAASLNTVRNYPTVVVSVAGGLGNGVLFLLDGGNHADTQSGLNLPLPFPDALQEFKVETSALQAQYGDHSAATVNAVTKSGTNEIHGDLFEFVRNGVFNARNFFGTSRDTLKRNQFGGVIGGPVKKDKLFFFGGYQGTLQRSDPPTSIAYVPTPAMLAGDFTTITSPVCNGARQITLAASQGFVNNRISPAAFDPVALKIAGLLPATADPCGKVTFPVKSNQNEHLMVGRMDYQQSQKHSVFGRFLFANLSLPSTYDGKNALTVNNVESTSRAYSFVIGDTYLVGPSMVSSFRAGMNQWKGTRFTDKFFSWADVGARVTPLAGAKVSVDPSTLRLSVTGNGFSAGGGSGSQGGQWGSGPQTNLVEDISLLKGSHEIGFGANYLHQKHDILTVANAVGAATVNGQLSGMPLADFLLGNVSGWLQGNPQITNYRQNHIGLYLQDSWKMTSKLRMNFGVRWEPYLSIYSARSEWQHFDPRLFAEGGHSIVYPKAPAGLIFPGDSQYTVGNHPDGNNWKKFYPRLGLVWDPKGDGLMTIRAAYGGFTDRPHMGSAYSSFAFNAPYGSTVNLTNVKMSNPWAGYPGGDPFPLVLSKDTAFPAFGNQRTHPFGYKPIYMHQWNLSIQRQIGTDWLLTANYVGNSTIHMVSSTQLNPAVFLGLGACAINGVNYPTCSTTSNINQRRALYLQDPQQGQYYASVTELDDGGTGNYNGLLLSAQKRLSHRVSVLANHTWSHCISDIWEYLFNNAANVPSGGNDRRSNRGNCQTGDQRHVFNLSAVLQTRRFSSGLLRLIGSEWQLSPIMKIRSAQFFTVTTGLDNALTGQGNQVPNLVPGISPYSSDKTVDQWLNPAAFAAPPPGTYGNLGRYNLKGPGVFQLDVALSRTFALREGRTLQLRAEAFNLPNHLNPSTPVATLNSGSFGKIQSDISGTSGLSAGDPRILQFALKLVF